MEILNKVLAVLEELQIKDPKPTDYLDANLAMDSQEIAELTFRLEQVFSVSLKLENIIKRSMRVSDITKILEEKILCLEN